MPQAPRLVPSLLTVSEATFAMDATADRCALLGTDGRIERTNAPWQRGTRTSDPVPLRSIGEGVDFLAACAQAALMGSRDAGTLHAQLRRLMAGEGDRCEIDFQRHATSGTSVTTPTKSTITLERVPDESGDRLLVSFASANLCEAQPTSVPEAGFAVPSGSRFDRLATALDSLPSHAAILDGRGRIVAVNAAWRVFSAVSGGTASTTGIGVNYLAVCERAAAIGDGRARDFGAGLASVLRGERHTYHADSRVGLGGPARKFRGRVTALTLAEGRYTLVTHTEITQTIPQQAPPSLEESAPMASPRPSIVLSRATNRAAENDRPTQAA
ncbi:hypothetical protein Poly30_36070 [Planctomycetes bacterium Poly30]|uniref:PAS fold protein n=1 Tax=Saltatorellus ferox TaxID=2528018 RepID=A0A518EVH3_9BACT|nr:hypothetical protein Poly30_36070 [Planctomycetes bacterium Poly30]